MTKVDFPSLLLFFLGGDGSFPIYDSNILEILVYVSV